LAKERVVVTRRGKAVAAVVSLQDLELLEAMEKWLDLAAARAALAKHHASGGKGIPWSEVKQNLGCERPRWVDGPASAARRP
jgi:hypothetical protein